LLCVQKSREAERLGTEKQEWLSDFMKSIVALSLLAVMLAACTGQSSLENSPTLVPPTQAVESGTAEKGFDIEGHRGARGLKPENTLPAFETALDLGVTTLELDLHLTADHVVVVWHDPVIDNGKCGLEPGTAGDTADPDSLIVERSKLTISNLLFEQLQAYRCDRNPDPDRFPEQDNEPTVLAGDDYGIISLAELFDFVEAYSRSDSKSSEQAENAGQVQFNIETKRKPDEPKTINDGFDGVNPGPFERAILDLIADRGLQERVIVQSFDHRSLWAIRSVNGDIRLAALTTRGGADPFDLAENGATIWSPDYAGLTAARLSEAHEAGLAVVPWTVNDPEDAGRLIEMGVDGLISDRPDLIIELR
jgi:glycerophosphoryl diester phosphodiesterase